LHVTSIALVEPNRLGRRFGDHEAGDWIGEYRFRYVVKLPTAAAKCRVDIAAHARIMTQAQRLTASVLLHRQRICST
jgi:hypothetical protein